MNNIYRKYIKRLLDIIFGIIGFAICSVIFVVIGPIIYLTDRGPILYIAPRLGKNGNKFKMFKFRSMKINAPDIRNSDGSTFNSEDDPRVTPIGKFIRKTSLDEFPQFINVLIGDMSLIGPRPDLIDDLLIYTDEQKKKLDVLPGITGYSQAYFRNSIPQNEKFNNDVFYVNNLSFLLDLKILLETIKNVFFRRNIYNEDI